MRCDAELTSPVGTYPIKASGAYAINYDFNYVDGTLTVQKAERLINIAAYGEVTKNHKNFNFRAGTTVIFNLNYSDYEEIGDSYIEWVDQDNDNEMIAENQTFCEITITSGSHDYVVNFSRSSKYFDSEEYFYVYGY